LFGVRLLAHLLVKVGYHFFIAQIVLLLDFLKRKVLKRAAAEAAATTITGVVFSYLEIS